VKTIYIVRHGQSEANVGNFKFGDTNSPLTTIGRSQAMHIAQRCTNLPIDVIVASSMKRAQETAQTIAERVGKPVETSDLFRERRLPSSFEDGDMVLPRAREDFFQWTDTLYKSGTRYEDGENFEEIRTRATQALEYLEKRREENILVVAHGFFLRALLACVMYGPDVSDEEFRRIALRLKTENTGVSVFNYGEQVYDNLKFTGWALRVWNDHAHLG